MAVKPSIAEPGSQRRPRTPRESRPVRIKPPRNNDRLTYDLAGIGLIAFAAVLLVSLASHRGGVVGDAVANATRLLVGAGAFVLPALFGSVGIVLIRGREQHTRANFTGGAAVLYLIFITWWHLAHTRAATELANPEAGGGLVGGYLCAGLRFLFHDTSSHIILFALTIAAVVWASDMRLLHIFDHGMRHGKKLAQPVAVGAKAMQEGATSLRKRAQDLQELRRRQRLVEIQERSVKKNDTAKAATAVASPEIVRYTPPPVVAAPLDDAMASEMPTVPRVPKRRDFIDADTPAQAPSLPASIDGKPVQMALGLAEDGTEYKFQLPPLTLLKETPAGPVKQEKILQEKQAILMQTLNDFKVGANVSQVAVGPTVTRYEVQLEPGILVKKIVSLADNLAMSLAAIDVRVEAPIPGKSAIGIEVPNDVTTLVSLRECLSTQEFMSAPSKLTFALGKDVSGAYKYADLARMPHLLIGGSTNSGKSVCLNALISSFVYRATPRELRFIMIDPKRVELSLYDGIPHLLAPVVKDVKHAAGILRSVLKEMEERYDRFSQIGTRNIEGFNNRVPPEERLPFIVVVIDELADLMMQMGAEVETSICRLAQLARATGIHLVIATQRPSVDVVTGTIKANIASRIAFAVVTQVDSRTILDMPGADRLIGRGDMLFMPIDASKPLRVQGCYVGEQETEGLVRYLKEQEPVVYSMTPSETSPSGSSGEFDEDGANDELFEPAVRWLLIQGSCSTSSLQRKFKIGYTRAARLVETMEALQIVGSQDGIKPREILLRPENLEAFFSGSGQGDLGQ